MRTLRAGSVPFTFAFAFPVCGVVAAHAVLEVLGDTFLAMLGLQIGRRVFVATIAGVLLVATTCVAGLAACVVVFVQREKLAMVEGCRLPGLRGVALVAGAGHLPVQRVGVWER